MKTNNCSRRRFLRQAAGLTAAWAAFPAIIPASALGQGCSVAASNRVTIGFIGIGARGSDVLSDFLNHKQAQIVAVCDVHSGHLNRARQAVNQHYQSNDCAAYADFRDMMARKDIDACVIATADQWHVLTALAAVRSGKDVYVEKPLGLSVTEDCALRQEVHKHKRIFQFGTQQRSDPKFRFACELVRNGCLGKLRRINVWCPGSVPGGSTDVVAPPPELNYDLWLGECPLKPYTKNLADELYGAPATNWRYISDYALGFVAGWGVHPLDVALWGAGPDLFGGPLEVQGRGTFHSEGICDTATIWSVNMKSATGVTLKFVGVPNGDGKPTGEPWPEEQEWKQRYGAISNYGTAFEGSDGWVHVDRERIHFHPESLAHEKEDSFSAQLPRSSDHAGNFLECIQSRAQTVSPAEEAVRADTLCHLSDIAMRLNRPVVWDPKQERFLEDPEANLRLVRKMRAPWRL